MPRFEIEVVANRFRGMDSDVVGAKGRIAVGQFEEHFFMSLRDWSIEDYKDQWLSALERVVKRRQTAALVTDYLDLRKRGRLFWWPLYPSSETWVFVQNHLLLPENIRGGFDPGNLYRYVPKRCRFNAEGERISEWRVSLREVSACFQRLARERRG